MKALQKAGGIAALYQSLAYLAGIVYYIGVLDYMHADNPQQKLKLVIDNAAGMYMTHLFMYVVFGVALVVLSLALFERLKVNAPVRMRVATAIGIIWAGMLIASGQVFNAGIAPTVALYGQDPARAMIVWTSIESVANGLGSANGEILGGLWTLLVSSAALYMNGLPKFLNYLGILTGIAGLASAVPGLNDVTGMFGILQLLWYAWLGVVLLTFSPKSDNIEGDRS